MHVSKQDFMTRWYNELWNNGNENIIDEMRHPDCKSYGIGAEPITSNHKFKLFYRAFKETYGNINVTIDKNFIDGDYLISLCTVKAIHNDTGKPVEFLGTSIGHLKDGQMIESWNCFNFLAMHMQTGKITAEQLL